MKKAICAALFAITLFAPTISAQVNFEPAVRKNTIAQRANNVRKCDAFGATGASAGVRFTACFSDLPATGGIADASGLEGGQVISGSDPFAGVTKAITLIWPVGTVASSISITIPSNITSVFSSGSVLSMASTKTATVNGPVSAGPYQIFAGAGLIDFTGSKVQKTIWVEWWGAKGDNSTNSTAGINAAFVAVSNGGTVRFASNNKYKTTGEVTLDHKFQVTVMGNDSAIGYADPSTKPEIIYTGGSSAVEATLKLNNAYACTVQGMTISSNDGIDLTKGTVRGIYITFTAGGSPGLSSRNKIVNNTIYALTSQTAWIGIDISNASNSNNEHHSITENLIFGSNSGLIEGSGIGIKLGHSQVKAVEISRNNISSVGTGVSVQGSFRAQNNSFNNVYTVWSLGFVLDTNYVLGDDVETIHNYIDTNQHPGNASITFMGNRVEGIKADGSTSDEFWIKTVGKFTFIDNEFLNNDIFNVGPPGPFTILGDSSTSVSYFENNTLQSGQASLVDNQVGLETMISALVVDGGKVMHFGGGQYDFGSQNMQTAPTDYIARRSINSSGPTNPVFSALSIGDNDIKIDGLYQEYGLSVTVAGATGSTVYHFSIVGVDSLGRRSYTSLGSGPSDLSLFVTVPNANATLSGSNYLHFKWPAQPGRPPATWSIYEVNTANPFEWREVVSGIADAPGTVYQTYDVTANWGGSFFTRPFVNETSDVTIPGRFMQSSIVSFANTSVTPSVAMGNRFVAVNTAPTSVYNFINGVEGQTIYIRHTTANTTYLQGGTIKTKTGADVTAAVDTVKGFQLISNVWYELF